MHSKIKRRMLCLPLLLILFVVSLQGEHLAFHNGSGRDVRHSSCRLRRVRQIANPPFEPSTTESFVLDDIEYKLCRYHVTWDEALVFCSSHKAHLATLDTEEKTAFVVQAIASSSSVPEEYWIGARKYYRGSWTWNSNHKKLSIEKDVISKIPIWYPGYESNDVHCLTIDRSGHDVPIFIPRACGHRRSFICQRDNERTFDNKIRMVAATRIGDQEFRLYSGRATWAEAVVQCREEGLQIGEVNTVEEARALAITMLRNRPEAIESAWIGGYTRKDERSTWRWLASGAKIQNNDMWRKNLTKSVGSCLLLDRHVCESPVYVETTCDRKRDVLCQKPPKKSINKNLVAVFVDGCPYWIGFHPSKWSEAKRSCNTMNASLVVLDSPKTISHMMTIMLDNRAELRHIWTDGNRIENSHWQWNSTGEEIPDFGKSFIPWCPDDGFYNNETDCLNLDRENVDSPLVYGLSCHEKQTYVCQPRSGDCIFHSPPTIASAQNNTTEDIPESTTMFIPPIYQDSGTLSPSKVTGPYPMNNDEYGRIQTTIEEEFKNITDWHAWKSGESGSDNNASSNRVHLTQYLKPLSELTLPSLPQFGIKVVSAAESTLTSKPTFEGGRKKMKTFQQINTSSSGVSPLPSTVLPIPSGRKVPAGIYRKASNWQSISNNANGTSNLSGFIESTIFSSPMRSTTARISSKVISSAKLLSSGSNNSTLRFTNTEKSTTLTPILPEDSNDARTKKYSMKTTRDLNLTRIASTTTTTQASVTTKNKSIYSFQKPVSSMKDFKDAPPKPVIVESFPVNAARPNTTLRKKQKVRTTTEALPYDAVDADYYNNYEAIEESPKSKVTTEDEAKDKENASNEYSDDYESVPPAKVQTKKKSKQTANSSIRKIQTPMKPGFRRTNVAKPQKVVEEIDEDEEDAEGTEETDGKSIPATAQSIPIAAELSKNLEAALVNMMRQSVEKKKNEKSDGNTTLKSSGQRDGNPSSVERNMAKAMKSMNSENLTLRPYYAFEGPMIVGLTDNSHLGGEVERTGEAGSDKVREFKFIGKNTDENSLPMKTIETSGQFVANETRRHMKNEPANRSSTYNIPSISMSGLPAIQPNDPNSLVKLGRYFKNKFAGFDSEGSQNSERIGSEDRLTSNQGRYGMSGPNTRPRLRYRPRPGGREDDPRRKGYSGTWERPRRPLQESDANYYENRRLYPRGYDFYEISMPQQIQRRNEERWREEQDRLEVAWPDKNLSNYDIFNTDEQSQVVSPRTFPAPIRTTRSFHEEPIVSKAESPKIEQFPDFRLSKLVKEVKIDLDQRLLRKYLEGFTRKIVRKDSGREDDWKSTWRQLLGQMLTVLDKMNVNVNGDIMKLHVGGDERENKLASSSFVGDSKTPEWKSGLRKQRKDSINSGLLKHSSDRFAMKNNETKLNSDGQYRRVSPNGLLDKDSPRLKDSENNYGNSVTKSSIVGNNNNVGHVGATIYDNKFINEASKNFPHREERTERTTINQQFPPRQVINNPRRTNWFQPKYASFNNSRLVLASSPSMIPRLTTVFSYQPVLPQLHHRILFPGWTGIRVVDRVNHPGNKASSLKAEYLPKGALSRIVGSEHKNEHFGDQHKNSVSKYDSIASTTATSKMESNQGLTSPVGSFDQKIDNRHENQSLKRNNLISNDEIEKKPQMQNHKSEAWRPIAEVGKNEVQNSDFSRFYNNERYNNESEFRKIYNNRGEIAENIGEEDITDDDTNNREDYEQKSIWSPAHHLTKALELSLLRKFGSNPSNSLRSKNLVARSTKDSEVERFGNNEESGRRKEIEESLEKLNEEPSVVSLRMIMNPDNKNASPRTLRQSKDPRILARNPRTVEVQLQFSGKEETANSVMRRNDEANRIFNEDQKISRNNQTFRGSSINNPGLNSRSTKRRPFSFIDKDRRRALMNRLRERRRNFLLNYSRSYSQPGANGTLINNPRDKLTARILSPRDRKSRTIGVGGKNTLNYENSLNGYPEVKHHVATVVRSFDEKNLAAGEQDKKKRGGSYGKEFGVDWTRQAASLFTDLKENTNEFTLYIDLTLGRVGSKTKNRRRLRG